MKDTARIIERHERLTRLYLDLLGTVVGVRRGGGLMTYAGFDAWTAPFAVGSSVHFSDDRSPLQETDTAPNPEGGADLVAPLIPQPALSLPGRRVLLGTFAGAQLKTLDAVRRIGVTHDDAVTERGILVDIDAPRGLLDASGLNGSRCYTPGDYTTCGSHYPSPLSDSYNLGQRRRKPQDDGRFP